MYGVEYKKYITRHDVKTGNKHIPQKIFVFGDNDQRSGFGGQAKEMRGEPNTIGIRVKKYPSMSSDSFYIDNEYETNVKKIQDDLNLLGQIAFDKIIVFPEDGIGTGMAMLNRTAPKTFKYLSLSLKQMFGIDNGNVGSYAKLYNEIDKTLRPDKFDIIELRTKKITKAKTIKKSIKKCKCGRK